MKLYEALKILAEEKQEQVNYLLKIGTFPSTDELALQFDDAYKVLKGRLAEESESTLLNENTLRCLYTINLIFDNMSKQANNSFWNVSSLENVEWVEVRKFAKEVLQFMSLPRQ